MTSAPQATDAPNKGSGWLIFAGVMLFLSGTLNVIDGVAAITDSKFYAPHAEYIFGSLHTWGWVHLILGALLICTTFGIWARSSWATYVGIGLAALNVVSRLVDLPAYPFWSLALIGIDVLIIYGLAVYGAPRSRTA
jgi:hypothetical protein